MTPTLAAFLDQHGFPRDQLSALQADRRFAPLMRACKEGRLDIDLAASIECLKLLRKVA